MAIWSWLKDHNASIVSMTTLIGVPLILIGIGLTIYQISQAKKQLAAAVIFTIQDEGRDLRDELATNQQLYNYIFGQAAFDTLSDETKLHAKVYVGKVLQYYSSIILQRRAEVISDSYWPLLFEDLCGAIKLQPIQDALTKAGDHSPYAAGLFKEAEQCK